MKRTLITLVAAAAISQPAFALNDREQGVLAGIVGTLVLQQVVKNNRHVEVQHQPPIVVQQQPPVVIQQQPPVVVQQQPPVVIQQHDRIYSDRPIRCRSNPVLWDQYTGRPIRYETVCEQR